MGVKEVLSRFGRSAATQETTTTRTGTHGTPTNVVRIDFDMMIKGTVYDRPGGPVKQYGVTVDGATRVITSGDFVNEATYRALVTAGAIRPRQKSDNAPAPDPRQKRHAG